MRFSALLDETTPHYLTERESSFIGRKEGVLYCSLTLKDAQEACIVSDNEPRKGM